MKNFISNIRRVLDLKLSLAVIPNKSALLSQSICDRTEYLCEPRSWLNNRERLTKFDPSSYIIDTLLYTLYIIFSSQYHTHTHL